MEWLEADPLPEVCRKCRDKYCDNCDYAGERWYLTHEDELRLRRKGLLKAIERLQRKVETIDLELLRIGKQK